MGCVINVMSQFLSSREQNPVPIVHDASWAPQPVNMGTENRLLRVFKRSHFQNIIRNCVYPDLHIFVETFDICKVVG
jgi:hypothetical protein